MLALGCESPPLDALDGAVALAAFGAPCAVSEDCESGICLALEDGRAVCSRVCGARTDCPAGALISLGHDYDASVLRALLGNPRTPSSVVRRLADHRDLAIADAAVQRLRNSFR